MNRRELHELMHCCRPDLSDLTEDEARALSEAFAQDEQLRGQFEAEQSWDSAIARAMHDVPVPDGLADRLLAAVQADASTPAHSRLRFLRSPLAAVVLAAAAVLLLALWLAPWRDNLTAVQMADICRTRVDELDPEAWRRLDRPVAEYPLDPIVRLDVVGYQACSAIKGWPAVVYRAELPPDHGNAYLFVIHTRQGRKLATVPPTVPDSSTGPYCIGVWKSNDCLYVLVVRGTPSDYLRTLRTQEVA